MKSGLCKTTGFACLLLVSGCGQPAPPTTVTSGATPAANVAKNEASSNEQVTGATSESPEAKAADASSKVQLKPVDYEGFQSELAKMSGKYVLVDVWSTACLPCMREYPNLVTLSKKWPDKLACVSMNVDYTGIKSKPLDTYLPKVTAFLEKCESVTVTNLISKVPDTDMYDKLQITSIPSILLFGPDGKLAHQFAEVNGAGEAVTYEKDIVPALEKMIQ